MTHGPWTTALGNTSAAPLSRFWRRRMKELPSANTVSLQIGRKKTASIWILALLAIATPSVLLVAADPAVAFIVKDTSTTEAKAPAEATELTRGLCVDENDQPLSGVNVALVSRQSEAHSRWELVAQTKSDVDGTFEIEWIHDGSKLTKIVAQSPERVTAGLSLPAPSQVREHILRLPHAQVLSGQITGPDGQGIAGVKVRMRGNRLPDHFIQMVTDEAGHYSSADWPISPDERFNLPDGPGIVLPFDYDERKVDVIAFHPSFIPAIAMQKPYGMLDLKLKPAAIVIGRVLYALNREPAGGLSIRLSTQQEFEETGKPSKGQSWSARTDREGRYEIGSVTPGSYWLRVIDTSVQPGTAPVRIVIRSPERFNAPDLILHPSSFLMGWVRQKDAKGSLIVPDGLTYIHADGPNPWNYSRAKVNPNGSFRLRVAPGRSRITVSGDQKPDRKLVVVTKERYEIPIDVRSD